MYVTEDTTRCDPETVKRLYSAAINCGARAIVICDTAGHATPMGTFALVRFILDEVVKPSGEKIRVDWHGHCDRGLAIANSLAALVAAERPVPRSLDREFTDLARDWRARHPLQFLVSLPLSRAAALWLSESGGTGS